MSKVKRPWLKKLSIAILVLIGIGAGIYFYKVLERHPDTKNEKAVFTVNAIDFIREFEKDDKAANKKYAEKIITVNGIVSEMEAADTTVNIKFIDTASGSYAIFAFQERYVAEAKRVKIGDSVSIKGSCSGGVLSEILGTEFITFKRCTLNN